MRSWRKGIVLLLLAAMLLTAGCAGAAKEPQTDTRLLFATDLHYLAPTLTDHGAIFRLVMANSDGKLTEYCEEITDAFLSEAAALRPDVLILTGDLSFNGEKESHLALAQKFRTLEEQGVPVLVLPGNHDLYRTCYALIGDTGTETDTVSAEEFSEIYADFGYREALSRDADSLSYTAQVSETTRVVMLDANTPHDFCSLSEETLGWLAVQLTAAEQAGQRVIVACHQNLFQHSLFRAGYVLDCTEALQSLLRGHGAPLFLSGHMHIQHIVTEGGLTEIAASPLTMGDCRCGLLELTGSETRYETRSVPGRPPAEDFESFAACGRERLSKRTRVQATQQLSDRGFAGEELETLTDYACALNTAYFTGDLSGLAALDPEGKLQEKWETSGTFFAAYFASIREEIGQNYTKWESKSKGN